MSLIEQPRKSSHQENSFDQRYILYACKIGDDLELYFWEKPWAIVQGFFRKFGVFKKWS